MEKHVSAAPRNNTSQTEIRLASTSDAGFIALLARVTFGENFGHLFRDQNDLFNYYNSTFSVEKMENSIAKSNNLYWIAFVNRLAVGYAKLKLNSQAEFIAEENVCQQQKIYVLKDFHSMKIGFQLQASLIEKARERGFDKIWLSVLNSNKRAIHFYIKNGFVGIGNHSFEIGKEHFEFIAMAKKLK